MIKLRKPKEGKSKAQAMVEFAIALPILLLVLYGIIETGRLVFLYSTVVNASRQAVRYGSTTGIGNGTGNASEPRYQDCDGIRQAAKASAFLGPFDDSAITIQYDSGPGTAATTFCASGLQTDASFDPENTAQCPAANSCRISVKVAKQFTPLVQLVPFTIRPVTASSFRTVLVSIEIAVTPLITNTPSKTLTPTATNTLTPTATATFTNTPLITLTPSLTPTITRTPTITLTPTSTVTSTPSNTPTPPVTAVPVCSGVTRGAITKSGNNMSMTITNPYVFPITFNDVTVTWNDDKGHQTGSDKSLILQSASLGGTVFWTGNITNQSTYTIAAKPVIPANSTVTLTFTFHQSYDNFDGTEKIYINLWTPGCVGNPIQS